MACISEYIVRGTSNYPEAIHEVSGLTPTVSEMIPTVSELRVSSVRNDTGYSQKRSDTISEIRGEILQDNTNADYNNKLMLTERTPLFYKDLPDRLKIARSTAACCNL